MWCKDRSCRFFILLYPIGKDGRKGQTGKEHCQKIFYKSEGIVTMLQGFITMNYWLRPIRLVLLFDGLYSIYDKWGELKVKWTEESGNGSQDKYNFQQA